MDENITTLHYCPYLTNLRNLFTKGKTASENIRNFITHKDYLIIPYVQDYLAYPCRRYRNIFHEIFFRNCSQMLVNNPFLFSI